MNYRDPDTRTALAAEYVLGTLRGRARQRLERLLQADFALRREVERWQNDLYPPLIEALPEQRPPNRAWRAISKRTKQTRRSSPPGGFWYSLVFWRAWGGLATAAVLALGVYLAMDTLRLQPYPEPDYVAVLNDAAVQPAWLIRVDRERRRLRVEALAAQTLAADRSFELWLLPGAEQAPLSLGLIPAQGESIRELSPKTLTLLSKASGLAVSVEPLGGSPTGQPTGPIPYQGVLVPPA